ncbi:phytoene/squalene synthase family protein [Halothermothrix orenii]|nr:phytoene/squalene synthase family protein [Halothermothrix orenii]
MLPKVSRSFALTIPLLDDKLYMPVLTVYLQDRLLDNFEDEVKGIDIDTRKDLMDSVVALFDPDNEGTNYICNRLKGYSDYIPDNDLQALTEGCHLLKEVYQNLPHKVQRLSFKWLNEMNEGMKKYLTLKIKTFEELDEYCYYVAGTVGGFLTELVLLYGDIHDHKQKEDLLENFTEAGLFLQKINIIRDIKIDLEERNKSFWPMEELGLSDEKILNPDYKEDASRALRVMLSNAKGHIEGLATYFEAIPDNLPGYRKFFSVNNALGIATLEELEGNLKLFYGRGKVKVSKMKFLKILNDPVKFFRQMVIRY